jgi:hypothetical protein
LAGPLPCANLASPERQEAYAMNHFLEVFFDGFGTMLVGLLIGGIAYRNINKSKQDQKQQAGDESTQTMVGRDNSRT